VRMVLSTLMMSAARQTIARASAGVVR